MFQKSSPKTYSVKMSIIRVSIFALVFVVFINSALEEMLKDRLFYITVGLLISIFLASFYLWRLENKREREQKETESNIKINPNDQYLKERLEKILNKRKRYIILIGLIGMIIGIFMVILAVVSL